MEDRLAEIVESVRARNEAMKAALGPNDAARLVADRPDTPRGFIAALGSSGGRTKIVAEIKRASPVSGPIREDIDPAWIARDWESAGAAAISVVTERKFFRGSVEDLQAAREAVRIPVLRNDLIIDPYQVPRSYGTGADAIMVVVRAVPDGAVLREIYDSADRLRLDAMTVVCDETDARRALEIGESCPSALRLVGVDSRDPRSFETDLSRPGRIAGLFPETTALVCLSGIRTRADIDAVRDSCPRLSRFLVGEALMRSPDPGLALRQLLDSDPG